MAQSKLQDLFLEHCAEIVNCTLNRLMENPSVNSTTDRQALEESLRHELKGVVHGILCEIDGATSLADVGLIYIVDEDGEYFERNLHEQLMSKFNL